MIPRSGALSHPLVPLALSLSGACDMLLANSSLTSLAVKASTPDLRAVNHFADLVRQSTSLTNINLCGVALGNSNSMKSLAVPLCSITSLTALDLSRTGLSDASTALLADAVQTHKKLILLRLEVNSIGDDGATSLAHALEKNSSITLLNLSGNRIGDHGAIALAQTLSKSTTLSRLSLGNNWIQDPGGVAFAETLKANTTLTALDLGSKEETNKKRRTRFS